jgi:hypothetical protein
VFSKSRRTSRSSEPAVRYGGLFALQMHLDLGFTVVVVGEVFWFIGVSLSLSESESEFESCSWVLSLVTLTHTSSHTEWVWSGHGVSTEWQWSGSRVGEELEDKLVEWVRTPHSVLGRTPYVVSAEYVWSGYGVGKEWVRSIHVVYMEYVHNVRSGYGVRSG